MKKQFFTFLMMIALVIVAGKAMAANEKTVYGGGTYSYQLNGIKTSAAGGTININYEGDAGEVITMTSAVSGGAPTWDIAGGNYTATFTIQFSTVTVQATNNLVVTVTDKDSDKGCSNFINYSITVMPLPTYSLLITASVVDMCQIGAGDAANNDNQADVLGTNVASQENSFTITITPTISGIISGTTYAYDYTLAITNLTSVLNDYGISSTDVTVPALATLDAGSKFSRSLTEGVETVTPDVFTVKFNSTTGLSAQDIVAALTLGGVANSKLSVTGSVDVAATLTSGTASKTVTVGAVPTIGSFGL